MLDTGIARVGTVGHDSRRSTRAWRCAISIPWRFAAFASCLWHRSRSALAIGCRRLPRRRAAARTSPDWRTSNVRISAFSPATMSCLEMASRMPIGPIEYQRGSHATRREAYRAYRGPRCATLEADESADRSERGDLAETSRCEHVRRACWLTRRCSRRTHRPSSADLIFVRCVRS